MRIPWTEPDGSETAGGITVDREGAVQLGAMLTDFAAPAPDDTDLAKQDIDRMMADGTPVQIATAPSASLRQQIAKALHRYDYEHGLSRNDIPSRHHFGEADAILDVRDQELERLRARHAALKRAHIALAEQAAKDQAAIVRVRALAADMRTWCSPHGLADHYADTIEAAINGPKEAP
ncbi:hypothetical protein [Streptomyces sp. NPDC059994]|uniref:hypothetical protein n=1 Tax=Streptomyces sp. NPDC059994 TaxID=3347029 RepID=UPI003677A114